MDKNLPQIFNDGKSRIVLIVESPEKSKTISKIFKDEGYRYVTVLPTIGHFTKIADGSGYWNTGIDPEDNFKIDYITDKAKKNNIEKLKEQVKIADMVYLCTDDDREGSAIAWSCIKFLKIPKTKYKRATYHEINKRAIFEALINAGKLDDNLVDAAHSRSCIDKMLGYRLSPIARNMINCISVGRCQSAALKIITDRENEILEFKSQKYIDLYLHFYKNMTEFKAKYQGTDAKSINHFTSKADVDKVVNDCKNNDYYISDLYCVDRYENPKPMFNTLSFQQEVTSKLNLSSKQAMDCAQKLFDSGKITYHRTDDSTCSPEFEQELKKFVIEKYGKNYYNPIKKVENDKNAQEGHEALRCIDLTLTPEKLENEGINGLLLKIYTIIYNRTVAASMPPAIYAETVYKINNGEHIFQMSSRELKFDGFKRVYNYSIDKDPIIKETFRANEILKDCSLEAIEKETTPPARYNENSLLGALKEKGIGRPSTYAVIIETVLSDSRGYCKLENKTIYPTDKGMQLSKFLNDKFPDIINLEYTRKMEESLDLIANGKLNYIEYLKSFLNDLETATGKIDPKEAGETCPKCGSKLVIRKGKFGLFAGCSSYPKCNYIKSLNKKGTNNE